MSRGGRGFSLIEVIVALAMLALIAIPAVGLATMVVGQSKRQMSVGLASEMRNRVDLALRTEGEATVFGEAFLPATIWGSSDLEFIELEDGEGSLSAGNDKYFRVNLREPDSYDFASSDTYRIILFELTWPHDGNSKDLKQAYFTSVFRK